MRTVALLFSLALSTGALAQGLIQAPPVAIEVQRLAPQLVAFAAAAKRISRTW